MTARRAALLLPLAALAAGCLYDFRNPAESLRTGEASGLVVADPSGGGALTGFPGVAVTLKGSAFDVTTHESGRFTLFGLPVGRHTLLFRKGTTWALEREVEVALGRDGQPEGVDLGQVVLRYSAAVEGTFQLPAAFPGEVFQAGLALDETTGQTATMTPDTTVDPLVDPSAPRRGRFLFPALGVGTHRIKLVASTSAGATYLGGPAVVTIAPSDTLKTLAAVAPHGASGTGTLRFRVQTVGLSLPLAQVTVTIDPDPGALLLPPAPLNPLPVASDGTVQVDVPEGAYRISVAVPPSAPVGDRADRAARVAAVTTVPLAPPVATAVVMSGQPTGVGTVYAVGLAALGEASLACRADADCGGLACQAGLCTDYSPPFSVGAGTPFCAPCTFRGGAAQPCDHTPGKRDGVCLCPYDATVCQSAAPPGPSVCVPACATGLFCTQDGVAGACN